MKTVSSADVTQRSTARAFYWHTRRIAQSQSAWRSDNYRSSGRSGRDDDCRDATAHRGQRIAYGLAAGVCPRRGSRPGPPVGVSRGVFSYRCRFGYLALDVFRHGGNAARNRRSPCLPFANIDHKYHSSGSALWCRPWTILLNWVKSAVSLVKLSGRR